MSRASLFRRFKLWLRLQTDRIAAAVDLFWSLWDNLVFVVIGRWLAVTGLVVSLVGLWPDDRNIAELLSGSPSAALIWWLGLSGLSIVFLAVDLWEFIGELRYQLRHVRIVGDQAVARQRQEKIENPKGYDRVRVEGASGALSSYVFNPAINAVLATAANPLEPSRRRYRIPRTLLPYWIRTILKKRPHFNEIKVRLSTEITPDILKGAATIQLRKTNYFMGLVTNELTGDRIVEFDADTKTDFPGYALRSLFVDDSGVLMPLDQSLLSNHIGVTSLLITSDDKVVLQKQGLSQSIDGLHFNLGSSGSADWADIRRAARAGDASFQGMIRYAMEREAREEVGISPRGARTELTGYCRFLHRGAKPEFFGVTWTPTPYADLRIALREKAFVDSMEPVSFEPTSAGLCKVVGQLLKRYATGGASVSMIAGLRFAETYLQAQPGAFDRLRGVL